MLNKVLAPIGGRTLAPQPVYVPLERPISARPCASVTSTSGRSAFAAEQAGARCVQCQAGRGTGRKGSSPASKGFGSGRSKQTPGRRSQQQLAFEEDEAGQDEDMSALSKPHYQMYTDSEYVAPRYVGNVEVGQVEGRGRGLLATADVLPGDLLVVSPALAMLRGNYETAPEPEDLHANMLASAMPPPTRRVLDMLYDGTPESMEKTASLTTLDTRFWQAGRGGKDTAAPAIPSAQLMNIITNSACADSALDPAAAQARHESPIGFIGVWPEFAMLNHSCLPNTSLAVVGDRLFLHSTAQATKGMQFNRNYLGAGITAPVAVRQAELLDRFGFGCNCTRCQLESAVSEELRDTLEAAHGWYVNEAMNLWQTANESEDTAALKQLHEEAQVMVSEVEEALAAEPDLTDEAKLVLKVSAYDVYDMLVMTDELLHADRADPDYLQAALDIIRAFAPGSDSHVQVALKHQSTLQARFELAETLARRGGDGSLRGAQRRLKALAENASMASELMLEAMILRYGFASMEILGQLQQALGTYIDGLDQLSAMQAQGVTEQTQELEINGIRVNITDRADVTLLRGMAARSAAGSEQVVSQRDGMTISIVDSEPGSGRAPSSARSGAGVAQEVDIDDEDEDEEVEDVASQLLEAALAGTLSPEDEETLMRELEAAGMIEISEDSSDESEDGIIDIQAEQQPQQLALPAAAATGVAAVAAASAKKASSAGSSAKGSKVSSTKSSSGTGAVGGALGQRAAARAQARAAAVAKARKYEQDLNSASEDEEPLPALQQRPARR